LVKTFVSDEIMWFLHLHLGKMTNQQLAEGNRNLEYNTWLADKHDVNFPKGKLNL